MTAAIQYILAAAQSLGSQVYKKSRMTILGLLVYYSAKTSIRRKYLLGCSGKLGEVLKQQ